MEETESTTIPEVWKKFLRRHWKMLALGVLAIALICIDAVLVFLWFVGYSQSLALVPATLGLWSMGYMVSFILHLIFWEVIFVGLPVIIVGALAYLLWWKRMPLAERLEYRRGRLFSGRRSRATGSGGGGISFLTFVFFCIIVYMDGKWNLAFQDWSFNYLVYAYLWAFVIVLILLGIPIMLGVIWWLRREMRKEPPEVAAPFSQPLPPPAVTPSQKQPPPPGPQPR